MKTRAHAPPRWAEHFLERLLSARARQVVVGDLREEYLESMLPQRGRLRADLWYIQQIASFVPQFGQERGPMGMILTFVSWFCLASTCWLGVMEMLLEHAGYELRASMAGGFALICLATILVRMFRLGKRAERWLWAGAAVLIGFGGEAFLHNARAAHFEGFVFVISLALMFQGALMLMTLGWPTPGNERWLRAETPGNSMIRE